MAKRSRQRAAHIGACNQALTAATAELKLLPAGQFDAPRGAMQGSGPWQLDAAAAERLVARHGTRRTATVIDYEHQTLLAPANGQPAPAAGWFTALEWREDGLYATDVTWTARAREMIESGEYRYISPVFSYDEDGRVLDVLGAGLTNQPGLDVLPEISLSAAARAALRLSTEDAEAPVNEELLNLLGLDSSASEEDVQKAVAALKAKADEAGQKDEQIAALKTQLQQAGQPDPAKYVPANVVEDLRNQVAALTKAQTNTELEAVLKSAVEDGRMSTDQAEHDWARSFADRYGVAALRETLEKRAPISALKGTQTGGKAPGEGGEGGGTAAGKLTEAQLAMCRSMGVSPEEYAKTLAAEEA